LQLAEQVAQEPEDGITRWNLRRRAAAPEAGAGGRRAGGLLRRARRLQPEVLALLDELVREIGQGLEHVDDAR
jgi:hypothetical protein